MTTDPPSEQFFQQDFTPEQTLLTAIRACLCDEQQALNVPDGLKFRYDPAISHVYITLFQEGAGHIRWGSRRKSLEATLQRVIGKLRSHRRFPDFTPGDPSGCRIMFEIVTDLYPCDPRQLTTIKLNANRLEPGIHGLKFTYEGQLYYYMPTDAVTHNLMTVKQVFNHLAKRTGIAKKTNRISARARMMCSLASDVHLIKSFACISYGDSALPLYRGYPVPVQLNLERIRKSVVGGTGWILDSMKPNGQFLYYYDPVKDSEVDFQHPRMKDPTYYNILRHSGGTITLLRAYELTEDRKYLAGAGNSIDFFLTVIRDHEYLGHYACYPFFNKKSKLGGAGIGLAALIHYYRLTDDHRHQKYIDGLVYHILSRISETGELIGYFIHPSFNNGREIIDPDEETKKQLFSFYYPGEALLGLALYLQHIPDIDPELRALILAKSKKALDFLIHERPVKYRSMFTPLPADGWLMQAIEEWVKIKGFGDRSYIDFVYNDAQAMIDHMYQEHNAPYFDYIGSFYYQYGEHAYPDGARCEGLIAAYYLARHLGEDRQAEHFMAYILKAAKNLLYTYNTPESCYAHKYPQKNINSFRFKLTRQWVRVDSVQHTACFYARLHPHYPKEKIKPTVSGTSSPRTMYAVAYTIERITGGKWFHLPSNHKFHGIRVNIERIEPRDICFTTTPAQWGINVPETQTKLGKIFAKGAAAAIITEKRYALNAPGPVLLVENSRQALEQIALFCRDNLHNVQRVVVTGTEGKTGFKFQLHHLLSNQTQAHATLDSSNLTVPILCSMASLNENDWVEIIEASVAQPNVGVTRSTLVKPHLCVITQIGLEHTTTHGSHAKLIYHKASIIEGLMKGGACIINADSENYNALREAIYRRKYVPLLTFGTSARCNGVLNSAVFSKKSLSWEIEAIIEGEKVKYTLPVLGGHAPLSSISVLLATHHLGYDIKKAADDYIHFRSSETMGLLSRITYQDGFMTFYDHSHRGSFLSFKSALHDLAQLSPEKGGRKTAVIGHMMNLGEQTRHSHEKLAELIELAGIDRLYTVGEFMKHTHDKLHDKSILVKHADSYQELENEFLEDLQPGDLIFMKGNHRLWLKHLAAKLYQLGEAHEIR
jgi:UDP-N-acetylmuramyl pentapeptide synthase